MEQLTGDNVLTAGIVLLAVVAIWNTLWTGWRNYREARKPSDDLRATVAEHTELLAKDNKRLTELEESNRLMLRGLRQLIQHEVSGDHVADLSKVGNDIDEYLINR